MKKHLDDLDDLFKISTDGPIRYVPDSSVEIDESLFNEFKEENTVDEKLERGVAIKKIREEHLAQLEKIEELAILDYVQEADQLVELYEMVSDVDKTYDKVSDILGKFESKFIGLSSNVLSKFEDSKEFKVELQNKKLVSNSLTSFLSNLKINKQYISDCLTVDIKSKRFLEFLLNFERKFEYINGCKYESTKCIQSIRPIFEKISNEFVRKISKFVENKFSLLFKSELIFEKRISLLKFSYHVGFLMKMAPERHKIMKDKYIEKIGSEYYKDFKMHLRRCSEYKSDLRKKNFIVSKEKQNKILNFINKTSPFKGRRRKKHENNKDNKYTHSLNDDIMERMKFLFGRDSNNNNDMMRRDKFENFFKEIHIVLINKSVTEYSFLIDFFKVNQETSVRTGGSRGGSGRNSYTMFLKIFQNTLKLLESTFKKYFEIINDISVCLLLYKLVTGLFKTKTKNLIIIKYFQRLKTSLWKRIMILINTNIESIRNVTLTKYVVDVERNKFQIVKKYANFLSSIYYILCEDEERKEIKERMTVSKKLIKSLLNSIAKSEYFRSKRESLIFVIKSTDVIIISLIKYNLHDLEDGKSFANSLNVLMDAYAAIEVKTFNKLSGFIRKIIGRDITKSTSLSDIQSIVQKENEKGKITIEILRNDIENVSKFFCDFWRNKLQGIVTNVRMNFSKNVNTQMYVLKDIFDLLYKYYQTFCMVVGICYKSKEAKLNNVKLIGIPKIKFECKKLLESVKNVNK